MTRGCVSLLCSVRHAAAQGGTGDGNGTPAAPIAGAGARDRPVARRGSPVQVLSPRADILPRT